MTSSAEAIHTQTFPLQVNQSRLDPALCGSLLALPLTKTTVGLWDLRDSGSNPVSLVGHKRPVCALGFSQGEPPLLCSAGEDYLIVWDVRKCLHNAAQGWEVRGEVILPLPGDVAHVAFSADGGGRVAVCAEAGVKVVGVAGRRVEAELWGHGARVTGSQFSPHRASLLVTVSDDRTAVVWDVGVPCMLHQTCVLGPAPLLCLAMNPAQPQVAVASASGEVRVLDLGEGGPRQQFRQLCQLNVGKLLAKARLASSSLPRHNNNNSSSSSCQPGDGPLVVSKAGAVRKGEGVVGGQEGDAGPSSIESSDSVLALMYVSGGGGSDGGRNPSPPPHPLGGKKEGAGSWPRAHGAVGEVLASSSPVLVVVSAHGALQVHTRTLEVLRLLDFQQPMISVAPAAATQITVGAVGLAAVGRLSPTHLGMVLGTLFESTTRCVHWELACGQAGGGQEADRSADADLLSPLAQLCDGGGDEDEDGELSMVACRPLADRSPLKAEFVPQTAPGAPGKGHNSQRGSTVGGRGGGKADPMNQPLTFKAKVKSSGYSQAAPRAPMFQPRTNVRPKASDGAKPRKTQGLGSRLGSQEYPQDAGPPARLDCPLPTAAPPSPVSCLRFSASGQHLACCLANKTSLVFPAPFGQKDSAVFVGHNAAISSVSWSNSGKFFLTASNDKTAVVWDRVSGESLLTFSGVQSNAKENPSPEKPGAKDGYAKEVRGAQFYYLDKFVLLIVGNQLCLYKYHLDPSKDEIRRYLTKSRYRLVHSWDSPSQTLTALAAVNAFHSHLAVCAGSNRGLEIFDLNEGRLARTLSDAHAKPAHALALNEGSTFTSQPQGALNVFASSATQDCVRLWDVRSSRCVLRLEGHANQALGCAMAFSPCGTYLGAGSEDKLAYLYDIRQGAVCLKLRGHSDAVTSVAFHPARPLMATGAIDGKVLLFKA